MCVVFLHYHPSSTPVAFSAESGGSQCTCPYLLVLAVNRDEFLERSTKPLGYWGEDNSILAGERWATRVLAGERWATGVLAGERWATGVLAGER